MSLLDTFNRANSATALGTTSDGSATWVAQLGTWGISSNQAYQAGTGTDLMATVDAGVSDGVLQCTLATITVAKSPGILFRFQNTSNYFMFRAENGSNYVVWRVVAGAASQIGSISATVTNGDVLKVVLSGSSIKAYLNGTLGPSITDTAFQTQTKFGLYSTTSDTASRWDDFSLVPLPVLARGWVVGQIGWGPANPPAFKASTTADPGSTSFVSSLAISSPACAVGDLLILCADTRNRAPSSTPTGWTLLTSVNGTTTTGGVALWYSIYTKTATSTDAAGTTYTVTCATSDNITLACLAYNPATIDVWAEAHTTTANGTGVLSWATPTITTTGSPRTIIEMWACAAGSSSINALGAPGTPTTSRAEVHMNAGTTNFSRQLVVDEPQLSAGTTTARTATDPNGGAFVAVAIAIHA